MAFNAEISGTLDGCTSYSQRNFADPNFILKLLSPPLWNCRVSIVSTCKSAAHCRYSVCVVSEVRCPNHSMFIRFRSEETPERSFKGVDSVS